MYLYVLWSIWKMRNGFALLHINLDCIAGILEATLGTDEAVAALALFNK